MRLVGNAAAHPNAIEDGVTVEEAADLSRLMTAIVEHLYVMPARIAAAQARRR